MEIRVTIQGDSPLLTNRFTEANAEAVEKGTSMSIRGSKGTPREQAQMKLYVDSKQKPVIPGPNIFRAIIDAGRFHKTGKTQLTTGKSSLVPAGMSLVEIECPITNYEYGSPHWEVDSRSVVNPATGGRMMAHRPRFDAWRIKFTLQVDETMFDERIARLLVDDAGKKIGLGDFRPARKGPFGRFTVISWTAETTKAKKAA